MTTQELTLTEMEGPFPVLEINFPIAASGAVAVEGSAAGTLEAVSDELLFAGSIHPQLRTVLPFRVRFERQEHGYTALVHELDEYGVGDTRSDALEDLRSTLQELYLSLERDEARLSDHLRTVWSELKQHVIRTRL